MNRITEWYHQTCLFFKPYSTILFHVSNWSSYILVTIFSFAWGWGVAPNFHEFSVWNRNLQFTYYPESEITVPGSLLVFLAIGAPLINGLVIAIYVKTPDYRTKLRMYFNFCTALLGSTATQMCIVCVLKNICGLPRPDLISRCVPDLIAISPLDIDLSTILICTQEDYEILKEGFRSFPSLHSSTIFTSMILVTCYNANRLRILDNERGVFGRGLFIKSFVIIAPTILALYVAFTRIKDNRHFLVDVTTGGIIGVVVGVYYMIILYPSLFEKVKEELIIGSQA